MKKLLSVAFIIGLIFSFYGQGLAYQRQNIYKACLKIDYSQDFRKPQIIFTEINNPLNLQVAYKKTSSFDRIVGRKFGRGDRFYILQDLRLLFTVLNSEIIKKLPLQTGRDLNWSWSTRIIQDNRSGLLRTSPYRKPSYFNGEYRTYTIRLQWSFNDYDKFRTELLKFNRGINTVAKLYINIYK